MVKNGKSTELTSGKTLFAVPSNVGPKTMPDYQSLFNQGIYSLGNGVRVFAGSADDPFFIDLGATFDSLNFRMGVGGVLTPQVEGDYYHAGIAFRQPVSTFKLFTYLTGMLKAGMTASTQLWDVEFTMPDGGGKPYHPMDATKEQHGPLTMRQALRETPKLRELLRKLVS